MRCRSQLSGCSRDRLVRLLEGADVARLIRLCELSAHPIEETHLDGVILTGDFDIGRHDPFDAKRLGGSRDASSGTRAIEHFLGRAQSESDFGGGGHLVAGRLKSSRHSFVETVAYLGGSLGLDLRNERSDPLGCGSRAR